MKRLAILTTLLLAAVVPAQHLDAYLALRKSHGILNSAGVEALETLVGERTVEVSGVVKGTMRVGSRHALLLERTDGDTYVVDVKAAIPDWLTESEIPARLLVRAKRAGENGELEARMLGAAPEADVAKWEAARAVKRPAPAPTSRSAVRPIKSARNWVLPASEVTPIYASFIRSRNRRLSSAEALRIAQGIVGFSLRYGVDARLIMAMVMVESGFNPSARSYAGAMGLGQLMPGTARGMGVGNAYDSIENLYGTVRLVRGHLDVYRKKTGQEFESLVLMLAAYNAGPGAVRRHGGVPPYRQTRDYVKKVIAAYQAFLG